MARKNMHPQEYTLNTLCTQGSTSAHPTRSEATGRNGLETLGQNILFVLGAVPVPAQSEPSSSLNA